MGQMKTYPGNTEVNSPLHTHSFWFEALYWASFFWLNRGSTIKGGSMKTNLDKFYKTSKEHETAGVWFEIAEGVKFLLKRFGGSNSNAVKQAMTKFYKPYAKQIEMGMLPVEKERELMVKAFVEVSLIGWKGIQDDKGQEIPFSKEAAIQLLLGLPDLANQLSDLASSTDQFKEDVGNS